MEEASISNKTWQRATDVISKVGFMDGAADGQKASFQSSFDTGYKLGFSFGLEAGVNKALQRAQEKCYEEQLTDLRKINCQICLQNVNPQDNVVNLYNFQKERIDVFLLFNKKGNR